MIYNNSDIEKKLIKKYEHLWDNKIYIRARKVWVVEVDVEANETFSIGKFNDLFKVIQKNIQ